MNNVKIVLWAFIALCAAVFAICVYSEPDRAADSIEHFVFHAAYIGLIVILADLTIRYKE